MKVLFALLLATTSLANWQERVRSGENLQAGYVLDSGNCYGSSSGGAVPGAVPWTARDAFVPLPEAGRRSNAPAPRNAAKLHPPESSTYPAS